MKYDYSSLMPLGYTWLLTQTDASLLSIATGHSMIQHFVPARCYKFLIILYLIDYSCVLLLWDSACHILKLMTQLGIGLELYVIRFKPFDHHVLYSVRKTCYSLKLSFHQILIHCQTTIINISITVRLPTTLFC